MTLTSSAPVTKASIPGLDAAPTTHSKVLEWVREVAELTTPDSVVWVDGSIEEAERINAALVESGTFVKLKAKKNSYLALSDPEDVARVEERTFICSEREEDAGPTNHWMDPAEMTRSWASRSPIPRTWSPRCG